MFRATMCPSSGADDWLVFPPRVDIELWLQKGCQNRLVGSVSIEGFVAQLPLNGHTTYQPVLTTLLQPQQPTRGENTNQSSAPDDGHIVARNMLSNL